MPNPEYDAIIIGAGIGGLAVGKADGFKQSKQIRPVG